MKEALLKESCQNLINQIVEDIHMSPQNADKSKFLTYDVKDASIIWNLMKGGYDFSFNQYDFIIENLQMLKAIASNEMWEKYHKKKEEGYTWGQEYKHHFRGDTQMIKPFPDERPRNGNKINPVTGDEMYPAIPQSKSVIKKPKISPSAHPKLLPLKKKNPQPRKWYELTSTKDICAYCGTFLTEHNITRDHVQPESKGGRTANNLVYACIDCNAFKEDMTLSEWLRKIEAVATPKNPNLKYILRLKEAVAYMIEMKNDHDLINDPENIKAANIDKHLYTAINKKKRKHSNPLATLNVK